MENGFCLDQAPAKPTAEGTVALQLCQNAWIAITKEYRSLQQLQDYAAGGISRLRFDAPENCMPNASDPKHMYIEFSGVDHYSSLHAERLSAATGIKNISIDWTRNSDSSCKGIIKVPVASVIQTYTTTAAAAMPTAATEGKPRGVPVYAFLFFLMMFSILWYCSGGLLVFVRWALLQVPAFRNAVEALNKEIPRTV